MSYSNPPYCKDRKGNAYVRINGRKRMLDRYGTKESLELYKVFILEWEASGKSRTFGRNINDITVAEVMVDYRAHLLKEVERQGPRSEAKRALSMFKHVTKAYRSYAVRDFRLTQLKAVRLAMIKRGLSRKNINSEIRRILRMFTWAKTNNYFLGEDCASLFQIKLLKEGEDGVKETAAILPVSRKIVFETIKHCSPLVADLVLLQFKTGCRSGELLGLTPADIDQKGEYWVAQLKEHKNKHRGKIRVLVFDKFCQGILSKYLERGQNEFLFQPCESEQLRRNQKVRKTPLNSGNSKGNSQRIRDGRPALRKPGKRYKSQSYGRAIRYACERAFPVPKGFSPIEARQWRDKHRWTPHQLRHTAGTMMRSAFGQEACAALLGHSNIDSTLIYAQTTRKMAIDAAVKYTNIVFEDGDDGAELSE